MPFNPYQAYARTGWTDWYGFFGTPPPVTTATRLGYAECQQVVQELGLGGTAEFHKWCKDNSEERVRLGVPFNPYQAYARTGWTDWYEFFGTPPPVTAATRLGYAECRQVVQELGLGGKDEFRKWCKGNSEERVRLSVPVNPDREYAGAGWTDWYGFLGTPPPVTAATRLGYAECQQVGQELGLGSKREFRKWCTDNPEERVRLGVPSAPDAVYAGTGWTDWYEFFGTTQQQ